jgi:hypothetical protein
MYGCRPLSRLQELQILQALCKGRRKVWGLQVSRRLQIATVNSRVREIAPVGFSQRSLFAFTESQHENVEIPCYRSLVFHSDGTNICQKSFASFGTVLWRRASQQVAWGHISGFHELPSQGWSLPQSSNKQQVRSSQAVMSQAGAFQHCSLSNFCQSRSGVRNRHHFPAMGSSSVSFWLDRCFNLAKSSVFSAPVWSSACKTAELTR